jgi:hypothetical protein
VAEVTPRIDTGHPFGLFRSVVHADGHVMITCNSAEIVPQAAAYLAWLTALDVDTSGYRMEWLPPDAAVAGYVCGQGCRTCRAVLSCGCDPVVALAGACAHGGTRRARRAAKAAGLNLDTRAML